MCCRSKIQRSRRYRRESDAVVDVPRKSIAGRRPCVRSYLRRNRVDAVAVFGSSPSRSEVEAETETEARSIVAEKKSVSGL